MAKNTKQGKPEAEKKAVTSDVRFSGVHNDPRFKLALKKHLKVKVDDRFNKEEMNGFQKKASIDRYGRKMRGEDKKSSFEKYYEAAEAEGASATGSDGESEAEVEADTEESEEESEAEKDGESEAEKDSENEAENDSESEAEKEGESGAESASAGSVLDSSDDSSSDSSDSSLESEFEIEPTKPETGDPLRTIAVVNMDWDNIRSVDLFATFLSFVPAGGLIESVAIYPSEYGRERMAKEDVEGPSRELFTKKTKPESEAESDSDSDSDVSEAAAAASLYTEDNGADYNHKSLRKYQLQRLRYYYAVVTCSNVATATNIYTNVDGTEYESTANIFDLRYVPEGMTFDDEPRDVCTKIPANYKPNDFTTDALQQSKVKLTWDETPVERLRMANRAFSQREVDEMDFKAYLASDSESDGEEMKGRYKQLLGQATNVGGKDVFAEGSDGEVDMEITFTPGLDEGAAVDVEAAEDAESTIAAYKRKEKERRKKRLENMKEAKKEEQVAKKEEKKKETKRGKGKVVDKGDTAALELLMMDDDEAANHFNMREIHKAEKLKGKKGKKNAAKLALLEGTGGDFTPELNDPRFSEIFENQEFAIDTTMPTFKKTETMGKIMEERQKRGKGTKGAKVQPEKRERDDTGVQDIVEKIKRRHK